MKLLIATLCAALALAQQQANFPLESLRIQGNEAIAVERILAVAGLKVGAPITRPDFNAARDRMLATGAFESVGFEYKPSAAGTGFDAIFTVVETGPLYRYRFEALPGIESAMRDVLHKQEPVFGDSIPPTPQVMNRYSSALAQSLGGGLQIIGELNADTPGELMIVFRPLGDRLRISEVNFTGNVVVPTPELWRVINEVAIGAPYSEPLFRQMLDSSIRALYEDRGRLRVAFPKIETVKSTENEGVVVAVVIDEGEVFTLGEVSYAGVPASSELNKLGGWIKGQPLIASEINVGLGRIRKSFREDGYLRVTSDVARTFNDQAHTVDLTITITPGARYTMGKLSIVGLDIISEPAIRKLWRLNQGDSYRESYPDSFLAMIQAEGYFDNLARTGAQADLHDDSHRVDVTLNFLGAKAAAEADRKRP